MNKLLNEYRVFASQPRDVRVLLLTNAIYSLVMPVIELFIGAYVMRNSQDVKLVVAYQLAVYTGIPITFLVNGWLLRIISIRHLYVIGMLMSGVSMTVMMSLGHLTLGGLVTAGILMGMSFGFYWSNRDFLALSSTNDDNRNYYYGFENFCATNSGIGVPFIVGAFIAAFADHHWLGGGADLGYQIVTGVVFLLAIIASAVILRGNFQNPPKTSFIYFRYDPLWHKMLLLAVLKGIVAGYIVTAPAMLIMKLVGGEGTLGTILSLGGILSAVLLYIIGRTTTPSHRVAIMAGGCVLFAAATVPNALLFNKTGVYLFMGLMLLARPLYDIAYFTIQMLVIDTVAELENRNKYSYIFNQEFGFFLGRLLGCGFFIILAWKISDTFALRYALLFIGAIQLLSIVLAKSLIRGCSSSATANYPEVEEEVTELR
jgi:YQGE family putative transporter